MKHIKTKHPIILLTIIAMFFALTIFISPLQYAVANAEYAEDFWFTSTGNGLSSATPFLISQPQHLRDLSNRVNGRHGFAANDFENRHIRLTQNIDLGNQPFDPIGSTGSLFSGNFDGNYHMVYNLLIDDDQGESLSDAGLFGFAGIGGQGMGMPRIQRVAVKGSITVRGDHIGGIVGRMVGGRIENSFFDGNITGRNLVGGIAGTVMQTLITNTYSRGNITGQSSVGGIIGEATESDWTNNFSLSRVSGNNLVSGIAGDMRSGSLESNVALNSYIGSSNASRVATGTGAEALNALTNNFAFNAIQRTQAAWAWQNEGANNRDGKSRTNTQILSGNWWRGESVCEDTCGGNDTCAFQCSPQNWSEWRDEIGWRDGIWFFRDDYLPVLAGFMPNGVSQTGRVPHIRPSIRRAAVGWVNCNALSFINGNELVFNRETQLPTHVNIALTDGTIPLDHDVHFAICTVFITTNATVYDRRNVTRGADGELEPVRIKIRGLEPYFDGYKMLCYYIVPRVLGDEHLYLPANQRQFVFGDFALDQNQIRPQFQIRYDSNIGLAAGGQFIDSTPNIINDSGRYVGTHWIELELKGNYIGRLREDHRGNYTRTIERSFSIIRSTGAGSVSIVNWTFGENPNSPTIIGFEGFTGIFSELYGEYRIYVGNMLWDDWAAQNVINAGNYVLRVEFNQTANFDIPNLYTAFIVARFQIAMPSLVSNQFTFNNNTQSISLNTTGEFSLSGDVERVNAGSYMAVISLNDTVNFEWANGSVDALRLPWSIARYQRAQRTELPVVRETSTTTILLEAQGEYRQIQFAIREYGSDQELTEDDWQFSLMFYNLPSNTRFEIFARYAAQDDNHIAGQKSAVLLVSTPRNQLSPFALALIIGASAAAAGAIGFLVFYVVAKKKKG